MDCCAFLWSEVVIFSTDYCSSAGNHHHHHSNSCFLDFKRFCFNLRTLRKSRLGNRTLSLVPLDFHDAFAAAVDHVDRQHLHDVTLSGIHRKQQLKIIDPDLPPFDSLIRLPLPLVRAIQKTGVKS